MHATGMRGTAGAAPIPPQSIMALPLFDTDPAVIHRQD